MCLNVKLSCHDFNGNIVKSRVAKKNIVVFKILNYASFGVLKTPYQNLSIIFNKKGIAKIDGKGFKKKVGAYEAYQVFQGAHAFYDNSVALQGVACMNNNKYYTRNCQLFYALIPKGTRYFVGYDGDIVSRRLIVFKDEESLSRYMKHRKFVTLEVK